MTIRSIILGLSIIGAAWLLQDITVTIDHVVVMEAIDIEPTTDSTDSDWDTEDTARRI